MRSVHVSKIDALKRGFTGEVLLPTDDAYDDARKIWNAMVDKRPAVIARCASTSDVVRGVKFARDHGLRLAVRGGGHNIAGNALCDDGLVIDLSTMKAARVDRVRRRVTVEGGATLADLDAATQVHGLATEELAVWTVLRQAPPLPFLPEAVHGTEIDALPLLYAGDPKEDQPLLAPLRRFGTLLGEHVGVQPYVAWQRVFDPLLAAGSTRDN